MFTYVLVFYENHHMFTHMKDFLAAITLSMISLFIASHTVLAQNDINTDKIDRYFTQLTENDKIMGSVAVLSGKEVVFSEAYGMISSDGVPATPETVYRVGSITKSFTAAMVLQLIEQGELFLDTKLDTYFPEMPNASQITIEHLLRHKSGLVNFTSHPDYVQYYSEAQSRN